jgi:hypothetical protein
MNRGFKTSVHENIRTIDNNQSVHVEKDDLPIAGSRSCLGRKV